MPVKMSDPRYEFECSRAELLGIAAPSYDEYMKNLAEKGAISEGDEQLDEMEISEEAEKEDENSGVAAGRKLDEINNILQSTQEKLHRFKTSYGSFTNILKTRLGKSLDISFSQSGNEVPQPNDETSPLNTNTDKNEEPIIGSIDNDREMRTNRVKLNGQSVDMNYRVKEEDEMAYKEIELNDTSSAEAKSPEVKKFLNFSFLNLGGAK